MKTNFLSFFLLVLWNYGAIAQVRPGWAVMENTNRAAVVLNSQTPLGSFTMPAQRALAKPVEAEKPDEPRLSARSIITGSADAITPEITELARGLENDPVQIFNYVFNHIDYSHYFGSKKGAFATLQEGSGNSFDTAALLVALLRSAGHTAEYRYGPAQFTFSELSNWCNFKLNPYSHLTETQFRTQFGQTGSAIPVANLKKYIYVLNYNDHRGFPYTDCGDLTTGANYYQIPHVWVRLTVGGLTWEVDPSFKTYTYYEKQDVKTLAGFNRTTFLSDIGGTLGTNSVTGISYTTLAARLTNYSTNIRNWIKSNRSGLQTVAITGGPRITQQEFADFDETWAVQYVSRPWLAVTTWPTTIPAAMMSKYEITSGVQAANGTFTPGSMATSIQTPVLNARKISLTFSGNTANLQLDDLPWETFTVSGTTIDLRVKVTHPFYNFQYNTATGSFDTVNFGRADQQEIKRYKKGNSLAYTFVYGFQNPAMHLRKRQEQLDQYRRLGYPDTDLRVKTEILNIMGLTWFMELEMSNTLLASQVDVSRVYQHRFGRVAQEDNFYIDSGLNLESIEPKSGVQLEHDIYLAMGSMFGSALEHGVLEQLQGTSVIGASTIKMLDLANSTNVPIYKGTSANWSGTAGVKAQLTNYPSDVLAQIEDSVLNRSGAILIPKSGNLTLNGWSGYGYYLAETLLAEFRITGGLKGGYSTTAGVVDTFTLAKWLASDPSYLWSASALLNIGSQPVTTPSYYGADPVEMATGAFVLDKQEMNLGSKEPLGLSFSRHYHSGNNYNKSGAMGYGWTHNYNMYVSQAAGVKAGLGQTTAAHMSPYLVACAVAAEIQRAGTKTAKEMATMALIAKWAVDQLRTNGVGVVVGNKTFQFVKMPDNTYEPPAGIKASLEVIDGNFVLNERHGLSYKFDSTNGNRIQSITDPSGNIQTFSYNAGKLSSVSDHFGRILTLGYSGGDKITSVTDGTRTTNFGYTGDTLTTANDVEGKPYTYVYDGENRITKLIDPDNRIIIQNTFDPEGRVATQKSMGDNNRLWRFLYSGYCNIEQDPFGGKKCYNYDERGRSISTIDPLGNFELRFYDGQDRITASTTPKLETTYYTYNSDHNLVTEADPTGETTRFFYDTQLRLKTLRDKRGHDTAFTYTTAHKPETVTDPLGHVTTYTYNANGQTQTVKDGENKITSMAYVTTGVSKGNIEKITSHDSTFQLFTTNAYGDVLTTTDAENRVITNTWNNRRQLLTTSLPILSGAPLAVITNTYDNSGNLQTTTDAKGNITTHTYNALSKHLTTTLPSLPSGNNILTTGYDLRDWPTTASNSLGHIVTTGYDAARRPITSIDPLSRLTETTFDPNGQVTQIKDPLNRATQFTFNARGEKTRTTNALTHYYDSTLDANGNQTLLRNRRAKNYTFAFDSANRQTTTTTPTGKVTAMSYWNNNLVKTITEPSTQLTTFIYNGKNLVSSKSDPTGTVSYGYDNGGLLKTVTEGSAVITRTYDERGRVKTFTTAGGDFIQYNYDANNNLTRLTYPDGKQVIYTYNSRNLLETVTDWSSRVTTYQYDRLGRLSKMNRPNGTTCTFALDAASQLLSIREAKSGKLFSYLNFQYDVAGQIKSRFYAPLVQAVWQQPTLVATYDDDNRLLTVNSNPITHDVDGNMTSGPVSQNSGNLSLTYNSRNQLTTASGLTYVYDAEGRRRTTTSNTGTTRDTIDPSGKLLIRLHPDATKTYYVYGLGLIYEVNQTNQTKTYHFDQVGSTIARTDDNGRVIGRIAYSAYGLTTFTEGDMTTPFRYNGQTGVITEPNGLLFMRARYYSPYLMRFLNADPIGFSGGSNWYAYADGNPISLSDPFGLCAESGGGVWNTLKGAGQAQWNNLNSGAAFLSDGAANALISVPQGMAFMTDQMHHVASGNFSSLGTSSYNGQITGALESMKNPYAQGNYEPGVASNLRDGAINAAMIVYGATSGSGGAAAGANEGRAVNAIEDFLGGQGRVIRNADGDAILMNGDKKIRFDINDPHGDAAHFHIEQQAPSGRWKDAGPDHRYYFKEGGQ